MKKLTLSEWPAQKGITTMGYTGISLTAADGSHILGRTIEGSEMNLPRLYFVIPCKHPVEESITKQECSEKAILIKILSDTSKIVF